MGKKVKETKKAKRKYNKNNNLIIHLLVNSFNKILCRTNSKTEEI